MNIKQCTKCKEWFPPTLEYFHKDKQKKTGLSSNCKTCRYASKHDYYYNNVDKIHEYMQEYYQRNRDKKIEYGRKTYSSDKSRIYSKLWRAKYPIKYRAKSRRDTIKRAARRKNLPSNFLKEDLEFCLSYWNNKCAYCGGEFKHLDHFIPLASSRSLGTVPLNIVPACSKCNLNKHARNPEEWIFERFGEDQGYLVLEKVMGYFDKVTK